MEKPNLEGRIELDDVLAKAKENTTNFINHLEAEEDGERIESVDAVRNEMLRDKKGTDRNKNKFIQEIKSGLGADIKKNKAYGVKIKKIEKPTLKKRIKNFFIRLYSKF